jgi:farnesyl diphosphate synthase
MADRTGYESLTPLTYKIGYLFQSQDDYLDCFGNVKVTGKNSTDLAEGKCTWFSCKTMELLNSSSDDTIRSQFIDNFGYNKPENVEKALEVMRRLKVDDSFRQFESQQIDEIESQIEQVETEEIRPVLRNLVQRMHGRKM